MVTPLPFSTPPGAALKDLDNDQLATMKAGGVPVIDIRRPAEGELTGVIEGSCLLPFFDERNNYDLDAWLAAFDKIADRDKPFILVCRHGVRTSHLGRYLDGRPDFSHVCHLRNGIAGWIEEGRPVVPPRGG